MYFNKFPFIDYQFPDNYIRSFNNISIRPAVVEKVLTMASSLEDYTIKDGETPETIAFDVYGDSTFHWVILLVNNITNIYTEWPKMQNQFDEYLYSKYKNQFDSDGTAVILTKDETNELLEFKGAPNNNYEGYINNTTVKIKPYNFIDTEKTQYTYETKNQNVDTFGNTIILPELFPVSYYEYEFELNERKRNIKIPSVSIVQKMKKELTKLLNE